MIKKSTSTAVKSKPIIVAANESCSVVRSADWDGGDLNGGSVTIYVLEYFILNVITVGIPRIEQSKLGLKLA